eukprot:1137338-Pelagomonas_calceolata.AAC.4
MAAHFNSCIGNDRTSWEVYKSKLDKEYPLGFPIEGNDVTYYYSFDLNIRDDLSSLQKHKENVADLIGEGVDFIANAQPNFAMEEAALSNKANLINIHGVTSNTDVAIVYRKDLTELRVACKAAIQTAEAKGLSVQEIPYTSSDPKELYGKESRLISVLVEPQKCTLQASDAERGRHLHGKARHCLKASQKKGSAWLLAPKHSPLRGTRNDLPRSASAPPAHPFISAIVL